MPRGKELDKWDQDAIKRLRADGWTISEIQRLAGVSRGSAEKYSEGVKVGERQHEQFKPVQWHDLVKSIPVKYTFQDIRYLLDVWAASEGQSLVTEDITPWLVRLRRLAPGLPPLAAYYMARSLQFIDEARERLTSAEEAELTSAEEAEKMGHSIHSAWTYIAFRGAEPPWPGFEEYAHKERLNIPMRTEDLYQIHRRAQEAGEGGE